MTNHKKLNAFTLAGLIIGPILGSGLILLPPLLYNSIGNFSLVVWGAILLLGFLFALIFGELSVLYPGEGGVSLATEAALGKEFRLLTSSCLICAVSVGPVAVSLIAGDFLHGLVPAVSVEEAALVVLLLAWCALLVKINSLGTFMLVVSSALALLFIVSSVGVLAGETKGSFVLPAVGVYEAGRSFLVAFWAIVGWEVIGSYSAEVQSREAFRRGVLLAALVFSAVYLCVALAICFGPFAQGTFRAEQLVASVFGGAASWVLSLASVLLCLGTLILFTGSVSRLISSLQLTQYTSTHSKQGVPAGALNLLTAVHIFVLALIWCDVLTLEGIVAIADAFFIANAVIGLVTGIVLLKGWYRPCAILLALLFLGILLFSDPFVLVIIIALFLIVIVRKRRR